MSAGTLSSNEDIDEQDGNVTSFEQSERPRFKICSSMDYNKLEIDRCMFDLAKT